MAPKGRKSIASGPSGSKSKRPREPSPPHAPPLPNLPWPLPNEAHKDRFQALLNRPLAPSKFIDSNTLQQLGLREEVFRLFHNVGWQRFFSIQVPSYRELTLEFLSSLQSKYNPYDHRESRCISFRCMGIAHRLSLGEFNALLGFPNDGHTLAPPSFDAELAWNQFTGLRGYNPSRSKSSHLTNPALRYIHKVLVQSMFGRGESSGVVGRAELFILWSMSHSIHVNAGAWFLKHLLHVSKSPTGKIVLGGLITTIASSFGFTHIEGLHNIIPGSILVDMDSLVRMGMCQKVGNGRFQLIAGGGVPPPNPLDEDEDAPLPTGGTEFEHSMPSSSHDGFDLEESINHMMIRFSGLETRMSHSEEAQSEILDLLRKNDERMGRMEKEMGRWKDYL